MKRFIVPAVLSLLLFGCAPTVHQVDRAWSPQGVQTTQTVRKNEQVVSELHRVLDGVVVEGRATYKHANAAMARNTALNLAINDLAKSAGEVLSEEDTTLYNEEIRMIIRTRARNIVRGYQIAMDHYDPMTQTAEIVVRQQGERIASEMQRHLQQ